MEYQIENVKMEIHNCPKCGIVYAFTKNFGNRKRDEHSSFYCPNGHSIWFPGKTDAVKIKELQQCIDNCNKDKSELFDEINCFRDTIKELRKENKVFYYKV